METFGGKNLHQCGKGRHILYVIIHIGQKISVSLIRTGSEIGKHFLLAKIFHLYGNNYMILYVTCNYFISSVTCIELLHHYQPAH